MSSSHEVAWRVRGVPRGWISQDLVDALEGADFCGVKILDDAPGRPWLFKIRFEEEVRATAFEVEVVGESRPVKLKLERLAGRKDHSLTTKEVKIPKRERQASATDEGSKAAAVPPKSGTADATMQDAESEGKSKPAARTRSRSPKKAEPKTAQTFPEWFEIWSAADKDLVCPERGRRFGAAAGLRAELASYIEKRCSTTFEGYFSPEPEDGLDEEGRAKRRRLEDGPSPASWDDYIQALARPRRHVDELSFRACSRRFNSRIVILVEDACKPSQIVVYGSAGGSADVYLLHKDCHYMDGAVELSSRRRLFRETQG